MNNTSGDNRLRDTVAAGYDAPAYVRRARGVQQALDHLLDRCRKERNEYLLMVRIRLGMLKALAGEWEKLGPVLRVEDIDALRRLHEELKPNLRHPLKPTESERTLRRIVDELRESLERFNRRWQGYLAKVDLSTVNKLREEYNRWYLLEKECAIRSSRLAVMGFQRLEPLTLAELEKMLPLLPVPG